MDYRTLDLTLISAKGLKKSTLIGKMDVYAVAFISGTASNIQKLKTQTDKNGDTNRNWNYPMTFTVNESAALQNRLTLVVKIKAAGIFFNKNLGEVQVPIKELLENVKPEGESMQFVSYQLRRKSGKPKGFLSFSYKFGEKFKGKPEEPVTAYPPPYAAAGGRSAANPPPYAYPPAYQQQQQQGYGYYPQPAPAPSAVYGGYPAAQRPPRSQFGMGMGTGLLGGALGGLLIGDMMSHGGGCGGGGCGGGGCGGGGCGGF